MPRAQSINTMHGPNKQQEQSFRVRSAVAYQMAKVELDTRQLRLRSLYKEREVNCCLLENRSKTNSVSTVLTKYPQRQRPLQNLVTTKE